MDRPRSTLSHYEIERKKIENNNHQPKPNAELKKNSEKWPNYQTVDSKNRLVKKLTASENYMHKVKPQNLKTSRLRNSKPWTSEPHNPSSHLQSDSHTSKTPSGMITVSFQLISAKVRLEAGEI